MSTPSALPLPAAGPASTPARGATPWVERQFAHVRVQAVARRLFVDDLEVALGSRAFDVLLALIDAGGIASKETLLERGWPGRVVEEANLPVQINALRKVLGNGAIVTVAGIGYKWALVATDTAAPGTADASAVPPVHNLPAQLTSFIGRGEETTQVQALQAQARLVTLVGAGGAGKSRLALQVGMAALPATADNSTIPSAVADGVWFAELATLAADESEEHVADTVARSIGIPRTEGLAAGEALLRFLRERDALLIVDNCEHVLLPVARLLEQLLRTCPGVRVLATSREPLRVPGERTYAVPPLRSPDPEVDQDLAAIGGFDSVQLFVARAAAASSFALTEDNAHDVAEICRRLDGIPLAIELAAARTSALSVHAIAQRLDDRFRLLKSGARTHLPRQQTLRALIEWSHDLLNPAQRALFRRLAVFPGSFTLEAVEAVVLALGTDEPRGESPVTDVDLFAQLVEKSLVTVETGGERYRLLETIRAFALEQWVAVPIEEQTRVRRYFVGHYLAAITSMQSAPPAELGQALIRMDRERENFLVAHGWCDDPELAGTSGLMLARRLAFYVMRREAMTLAQEICEHALQRPQAAQRTAARANVLFWLGWINGRAGKFAESKAQLRECLEISREVDEQFRIPEILLTLATAQLHLGDLDSAESAADEAIRMARHLGVQIPLSNALIAAAHIKRSKGEIPLATSYLKDALENAKAVGNVDGIALVQIMLAALATDSQDHVLACQLLRTATSVVQADARDHVVVRFFDGVGGLAAATGAWERGAFFLAAADKLLRDRGYVREPADQAFVERWQAQCRQHGGQHAITAAQARGASLEKATMQQAAVAWLGSLDVATAASEVAGSAAGFTAKATTER